MQQRNPALGIKAAGVSQKRRMGRDQVSMGWMFILLAAYRRITCTGRSYRTNTLWPATTTSNAARTGTDWTVFSEPTLQRNHVGQHGVERRHDECGY